MTFRERLTKSDGEGIGRDESIEEIYETLFFEDSFF